MFVRRGADKLRVDVHLIRSLLNTALENVGDTKLIGDVAEIRRPRRILLRRNSGDHFESSNFGKSRQDFVLNPGSEVSIGLIFAEVFKWQHCDAFFRRSQGRTSPKVQEPNGGAN